MVMLATVVLGLQSPRPNCFTVTLALEKCVEFVTFLKSSGLDVGCCSTVIRDLTYIQQPCIIYML